MGSIVTYRCTACTFSTSELRVGWGKKGRAAFWGGLVHCQPCGELGTIDLAVHREYRATEPKCGACGALLNRLEGTSVQIPCPRCQRVLRPLTVGMWS